MRSASNLLRAAVIRCGAVSRKAIATVHGHFLLCKAYDLRYVFSNEDIGPHPCKDGREKTL